MQLTKVNLIEFKAILLKDYGQKVDDKTATQLANDFLTFLEAILNKQKLTKISEKRKNDY